MEKGRTQEDMLADLAGVPYDLDDLDVEVAMVAMPEAGPRRASALIALRALQNPQWRASFEARGKTFNTSTAAPSFYKDAPDVPLFSPEMKTWVTEKVESRKPRYSQLVKGYHRVDSFIKGNKEIALALTSTAAFLVSFPFGYASEFAFSHFLTQPALSWIFAASMGAILAGFMTKAFNNEYSRFAFTFLLPLLWLIPGRPLSSVVMAVSLAALLLGGFTFIKLSERRAAKAVPSSTTASEASPWRGLEPQTRYGSSLSSVRSASSLLRVNADQYSIELKEASEPDLVASVIAADAWLLSYGATHFNQAPSYGPDAIRSLGAILARVSGQGETSANVNEGHLATEKTIEGVMGAIEDWKAWVLANTKSEEEALLVWMKVVSDLTSASDDAPTAQLGRLINFLLLP